MNIKDNNGDKINLQLEKLCKRRRLFSIIGIITNSITTFIFSLMFLSLLFLINSSNDIDDGGIECMIIISIFLACCVIPLFIFIWLLKSPLNKNSHKEILYYQQRINDLVDMVNSYAHNPQLELLQSLVRDAAQEHVVENSVNDSKQQDEELGFYVPEYECANTVAYRELISECRASQKEMMLECVERASHSNWTVNGNQADGQRMMRQTTKLLFSSYNASVDSSIGKITVSNYWRTIDKIRRLAITLSRLGSVLGASIPTAYVDLKCREADLQHQYALKKQDEKYAIAEAKAQAAEMKKAQKELERERAKAEKNIVHFNSAILDIETRIETEEVEEEKVKLIDRLEELKTDKETEETTLQDITKRTFDQRAGFVYIISNIGSFGEGIYKIGLTRRFDPQDRVNELGSASVPFRFDVHAFIFSKDAVGLETALHNAFADKRVNMANSRKEFFRVSLDEIKNVIAEYDSTVIWTDVPEAAEYRQSQEMAMSA